MAKCIPKALLKFQHPTPVSPQHQPYKHVPIQYGANIQKVDITTSDPLSPDAIKCVQDIIGMLLYYGHAIDPTLLTALSSIDARQANGTTAIAESCQQLLDYVETPPFAGICYKACDMILPVHTNASYLSEQKAKAGHQHTFISPKMATKNLTTATYSPYHPSSNTSCPPHPKWNSPHFIMAANSPPPCAPLSKKWATHSTNAPW
jgi:hypothetical protein